jgi:hypothetical protein
VVIGGQTLCLVLTLLVTPVAYSLLEDAAKALARWRPYLPRLLERPRAIAQIWAKAKSVAAAARVRRG